VHSLEKLFGFPGLTNKYLSSNLQVLAVLSLLNGISQSPRVSPVSLFSGLPQVRLTEFVASIS